jgi:acyl dehydratase
LCGAPEGGTYIDGVFFFDHNFVGQRFRNPVRSLTAEDIKRFAEEFNPQPFQLDENAACSSLFGGLTASGGRTASITIKKSRVEILLG